MDQPSGLTRRSMLRAAAGAGAALATSAAGLPAWARPIAAAGALKRPGSRPFPDLPEGTHSMPKIEHIVILMMENHSFDNVLGRLAHTSPARGGASPRGPVVTGAVHAATARGRDVDGLPVDRHGRVTASNPDANGTPVFATPATSPCQLSGEPSQAWNASHISWDNGRNDGFVRASGPIAMRYWDGHTLPFTYSLAGQFPIGARYFCSCLAQTYPNRRFLFTATASGTIATDSTTFEVPAANGTIFDRLDKHGISWANYAQQVASLLIVPNVLTPPGRSARLKKIDAFYADAAAGRLPAVTFLDPNYDTTSEENPQDIQVGEQFVHDVVTALMHSPNWPSTAFFLTYDEHGGYYDHVPPPRAVPPDNIPPMLAPGYQPGGYDRYGFRVPFIAVSPWARRGYISRVVQDHTSILRFIERKWNLGAMTYRDANAADLTDYFDFRRPAFIHPPALAAAPPPAAGLAQCRAAGLTPPLPT
jgi:phospholipase C